MTAPVLLLVHGYPFDHTLWDWVRAGLDKTVRVLAPDLRGFGGTAPGDAEPALEAMADDLNRLLDQHQAERAVLAGMSMGGYVALAFAERYANRLAGLALVSSQAKADTDEARAGRRAMIEKIRREGPQTAAAATLPKLFSDANTRREDLAQFPIRATERAGVAGLTWALEAMARRPDRTAVWQRLTVPTLVLHGTEDKFIPIERAREVSQLSRTSRFVEAPGAGHGTPLEAPRRVAQALVELLMRSSSNSRHVQPRS